MHAQRGPGDWDAICNQRRVAVHALENPGSSDIGVYMCRKLLRDLAEGKAPVDTTKVMSDDGEETLHSVCSDTTLNIPRLPDREEDRKLMKEYGRKVYTIVADADSLSSKDRRNFILARLHELDDGVHEEA